MRNRTFFKNKEYPGDSSKFFTTAAASISINSFVRMKKRENFQFFFFREKT